MERLESHFRFQRQTMGILVQLNEAAVANGIGTNTDSSTAAGESLIDSGGASTASFSDSSVSSRGGPWASLCPAQHPPLASQKRLALERARSFESRLSSGGSLDHCQPPRRMDSSLNIGFPPRYRPFRLVEDEDSSDTDTDVTAESDVTAANRWRQSSPIRSPRGVKQRMRLLWREYLSQVVNVQLNNMGYGVGSRNAPSSQQPGAPDSGGDNNDPRTNSLSSLAFD
ncbi:uncharacterized protein LOC124340746 [Daphnia pulicaria]|uniref:uncharacterized protein LOC124340746 n=1 Tax=Daphnia pulicaria TaxID=35523 RepID=UPI001EEAC162|nr:uncharacterized protein LOC124340746 [Daphnia pulicaria]